MAAVRRLVIVATAVVLVDSTLYAALTPLLPHYADRYDLSKAGAGLLAACVRRRVVRRRHPRRARGRTLRAAARGALPACWPSALPASSSGSPTTPWTLGIARFTQGIGSSLAWAGAFSWIVASVPRARRGEAIGTAMGGAVVGAMLGPAIGAVAGLTNERATFLAFALVAWGLALAARRLPDSGPQPPSCGALRPRPAPARAARRASG